MTDSGWCPACHEHGYYKTEISPHYYVDVECPRCGGKREERPMTVDIEPTTPERTVNLPITNCYNCKPHYRELAVMGDPENGVAVCILAGRFILQDWPIPEWCPLIPKEVLP